LSTDRNCSMSAKDCPTRPLGSGASGGHRSPCWKTAPIAGGGQVAKFESRSRCRPNAPLGCRAAHKPTPAESLAAEDLLRSYRDETARRRTRRRGHRQAARLLLKPAAPAWEAQGAPVRVGSRTARADAEFLREELLRAAREADAAMDESDEYGERYTIDFDLSRAFAGRWFGAPGSFVEVSGIPG